MNRTFVAYKYTASLIKRLIIVAYVGSRGGGGKGEAKGKPRGPSLVTH